MDREINRIISNIDFENIQKHPNILIAASFWNEKRYHAAKVCYKFMRMIDDLIDDRKALGDEISCLEQAELSEKVKGWIDCLQTMPESDPFYTELIQTISTFKIPLQLFHNFAKSMLYDISHDGFSSMENFLEYAEGASVAPASIFVHLCCLSEEDGEYLIPNYNIVDVARPCAIFSYLVHIIRDFQEDQENNLNYFASDILEQNDLQPSDLKEIAHGGPVPDSFRNVIKVYKDLARKYQNQTLQEIQNQSSKLSSRNLFSLKVIYELYKMVFDRIDIENGNFTTRELNPTALEIREKVVELASDF